MQLLVVPRLFLVVPRHVASVVMQFCLVALATTAGMPLSPVASALLRAYPVVSAFPARSLLAAQEVLRSVQVTALWLATLQCVQAPARKRVVGLNSRAEAATCHPAT